VHKDFKDHRVLKVQEDHKDLKVLRVLRVNLELQFQLKDQLEIKEIYLHVMQDLLEMLMLSPVKEDFMFVMEVVHGLMLE